MKVMKLPMMVPLTLSLWAAPVVAGAQAQQQPQTAAPANPNEVICEKQEVTGSRLAHRKVCMTRSQWEDTKRQDRSAVEKVQSERGLIAPVPGG